MKSTACLLTLLGVVLTAAPASADKIVLVDGKVLDGVTIEGESIEGITYRSGRARGQSVKPDRVRSVEYSRTSQDYRDGMAQISAGDLVVGARILERAASDEGLDSWKRATAMSAAADAMLAAGQLSTALEFYNQVLSDDPKTRHLPRVLLGLGKAALLSQKYAEAGTSFDTLKQEAASRGFGDRWSLEAEFWALRTKHVQGGARNEIMAGYQSLRGKAGEDHEGIANQCALQIGRLQLEADQPEAALPLFNEIIDSRLNTEREVAAGAFNGQGRCLFHFAETLRDNGDPDGAADEFKAARLDFLRVHVHYPDVKEHQAEALFWAAKCFENLGEPGADREAALLQYRLTQGYPASPWAKRVGR